MILNHAGSRGFGPFETLNNQYTLSPQGYRARNALHSLWAGQAASEIATQLLCDPQPGILTLTTTNKCNLNCRHCYLQTDDHKTKLTKDDWLNSLLPYLEDSETQIVTVVGREPLLDDTALTLLKDIGEYYPERNFRLGFITNGTLLKRHSYSLNDNFIDFIDISLDGPKEIHDSIRGSGAYKKLTMGIESLSDSLRDRVTLLACLSSENDDHSASLVDEAVALRVRRLNYGIFVNSQGVPENIAASTRNLVSAIQNIEARVRDCDDEIQVVVDLDHNVPGVINEFIARGWISLEALKFDDVGDAFAPVWQNGKSGLFLRIGFLPADLWHNLRITAEGLVLASEDVLFPNEYPQRALGKITGTGLEPLSSIVSRARSNSMIHRNVRAKIETMKNALDIGSSNVKNILDKAV